ncbi:MAG: RRXRR domain-containing protein [Desulfovibrio sp.]|nr:RRXRR domain-containing protein [Desulfovibrio sp.]
MYRRRIRSANLCYRPPRFDKRRRRENWLAPGIQHRIDATVFFIRKWQRLSPLDGFDIESVLFDKKIL